MNSMAVDKDELVEEIKEEIKELEAKAEEVKETKPLVATSLADARALLERDFLVQGSSGIVYKLDMCNQPAYARLMGKMEGGDTAGLTQFVIKNMLSLGVDILPDIILEPKVGPNGLDPNKLPPADITLIVGSFIAGPSTTGSELEEDESFRDE